jgi:predicted small lipoprotein YifL
MPRSNPPSHPPLAATRQRSAKALLAIALMMTLAGCADHPPLERPSYDLAKALYAVCNRQSTEHLAKFDEVLAEAIAAGKVGPQEEAALRQIAQEAAAGKWYDAQEMARELIASQNS